MTEPTTRDAYLVLHLWMEDDGEVRGRITHPRLPGPPERAVHGELRLQTLTCSAIHALARQLSAARASAGRDAAVTPR